MVDGLRNALDRLLHDNPGVRREKRVSAHLTRRDGRANDEGMRGQADVLALARNEQILDPVQGRSGVPVAFATRPLWLLRSRDRSGRNDFHVGFEPGGC